MIQEELLVAWIRQLEQRPEDVERAKAKLHTSRAKNKGRFDRGHRLRPKKIEEGHWTRITVSVAGKRIKAFKKRHEGEPGPRNADDKDGWTGAESDLESEG